MRTLMKASFGAAVLAAAAITTTVHAQEARRADAALTAFGAEVAGNKAGTIPAYADGLPASTRPAGFVPNSGRWADPYADEKPLFSITAKNMAEHADKLSETSRELLKRHPSFRMDVYPTHRSVAFSKGILAAMAKNSATARLTKNGLAVEGVHGPVPFPDAKNGHEVMWNHLLRPRGGFGNEYAYKNWYVDAGGRVINSGAAQILSRLALQNPKGGAEWVKADGNFAGQCIINYTGPARNVGDVVVLVDSLDTEASPRRSWSYSASTRRVRLAPDLAYDTPAAPAGGVFTYDDSELIFGKLDRFNYKLIGMKEMYVPYNNYKLIFGSAEKMLTPKHLNPDAVRWELHRTYVVEATLKPGLRHIYSKRTFYVDEDKSGSGMSDAYDGSGKLFRGTFMPFAQLYDIQSPYNFMWWSYDLSTGVYALAAHGGDTKGFFVKQQGFPSATFTPDAMAARSGR